MTKIFADILGERPPIEYRDRVIHFAKALASGVVQGYWQPKFFQIPYLDEDEVSELVDVDPHIFQRDPQYLIATSRGTQEYLQIYLAEHWWGEWLDLEVLVDFGYMFKRSETETILTSNRLSMSQEDLEAIDFWGSSRANHYFTVIGGHVISSRPYLLTEKAFSLLNQPVNPPTVFISYKRDSSSALALLILKHLQIKGMDTFLDMDIEPGDDWEQRIKNKVANADYFVMILGKNTLESTYIQDEIAWAVDAGCTIIPFCHGEYTIPDDVKVYSESIQLALKKNAIIINVETASEYNAKIIQLLNRLGYAP